MSVFRYSLPPVWDALKFATRYGLRNTVPPDFWVSGDGMLEVNQLLPDNPPIFDAPDPIIPAPPGVWVHEMKSLTKRNGDKLIDGAGTSCYHIVVENEAKLSDPWLQGITIDMGSTAYLMDKGKTVVWDGTKWK